MNELLHRYFMDTLTEPEKTELFRKLETDSFFKEEFVRMQNLVAISEMIPKKNDDEWSERKFADLFDNIRTRAFHRAAFTVMKYAAVAILVSSFWILLNNNLILIKETDPVEYTYIEVPKGQNLYMTLQDGTELWLSSRSSLKISNQFNKQERIIELDGEGFFSVAKDPAKPFIVNTQQYSVEVTGTQFNVFAYSQSSLFKTDLIEGSVSVYDRTSREQQVNLNPKEAVFLKDGVLHISSSNFNSSLFRDGIYYFENQRFEELKERLELWYNVKINVKQPDMLAYVFSGKFRQSDHIEFILEAIQETGRFSFKIIDDKVIEIY